MKRQLCTGLLLQVSGSLKQPPVYTGFGVDVIIIYFDYIILIIY